VGPVSPMNKNQKACPLILGPLKIGRFFPFGIQPGCGGELASVAIDVNSILRVFRAEGLLYELDLKPETFRHLSNRV
jgi:hypothetical protein